MDLKNEHGRAVVKALANNCDVLIENFRPGVMEGWNLGPADLKSDLVYARISGYGQTGPKAQEPGYASVCEAYGGLRHVNGAHVPFALPGNPSVFEHMQLRKQLRIRGAPMMQNQALCGLVTWTSPSPEPQSHARGPGGCGIFPHAQRTRQLLQPLQGGPAKRLCAQISRWETR